MYDKNSAPTEAQIIQYRYLSPMLDSALAEMREFSKKKQDGLVSATKIKILNKLLGDLRSILANEASVSYLTTLSEEDLSQNSDAVLILGQYRAALASFTGKHDRYESGYGRVWVTKEWIERHDAVETRDQEEHEEDEEDDEGDDGEDGGDASSDDGASPRN